jgi:hypothetical protein
VGLSGRAEQDDVAGFGEPAAALGAGDLGAVESGLGGEVDAGDRLGRRESGIADALACSGFGAGIGFHCQHRGQVVLKRPRRITALFGQAGVVSGRADRLDLRPALSQP